MKHTFFSLTALMAHTGCGSGLIAYAKADGGGGSGTLADVTQDPRTHRAFDESTYGAMLVTVQKTHDIDGRSSGASATLKTARKTSTPPDAIGMSTGQAQEDTRTHRAADGRDMGAHQTTQRRVLAAAGEHGVSKTVAATKQRSRHVGQVQQRQSAAHAVLGSHPPVGTSFGKRQQGLMQLAG